MKLFTSFLIAVAIMIVLGLLNYGGEMAYLTFVGAVVLVTWTFLINDLW